MNTSIVFTFIGNDKPGLIETLSNTVSAHNGNWLESRMSQLAGLFAGIARVQVNKDNAKTLTDALKNLSTDDLNVVVQSCSNHDSNHQYGEHELSLVGHDRPGIVKELSGALASHGINVCEMNTDVTSAPMTAESLFTARALIQVPVALDLSQLSDELDNIAEELDVDIKLER